MEILKGILMIIKEIIWTPLTLIEIDGTPIFLALALWAIAITIIIADIRYIFRKQKR